MQKREVVGSSFTVVKLTPRLSGFQEGGFLRGLHLARRNREPRGVDLLQDALGSPPPKITARCRATSARAAAQRLACAKAATMATPARRPTSRPSPTPHRRRAEISARSGASASRPSPLGKAQPADSGTVRGYRAAIQSGRDIGESCQAHGRTDQQLSVRSDRASFLLGGSVVGDPSSLQSL